MGRAVLCPVALDDRWKNSPWPKRVIEPVMEYNILDFSNWKDDSRFGATFNKLIDGLELFYKKLAGASLPHGTNRLPLADPGRQSHYMYLDDSPLHSV